MKHVRDLIPKLQKLGITITDTVSNFTVIPELESREITITVPTVVVSKEISLGLQSIHVYLHICRYSDFSFYAFRDVYLVPEAYRSVYTRVFDEDKYRIAPKVERAGYFTVERISAYAVHEGYYRPIEYRIAQYLNVAIGKASSIIKKYYMLGDTPLSKEIDDRGVLQYALVCASEDRVCRKYYYDLSLESNISKREDFERILYVYFGRAFRIWQEGKTLKYLIRDIPVREHEMSQFMDRMNGLIKWLSKIM